MATNQRPKAQAPSAPKFAVTKGADRRPHATILTGRPGVGKTWFCSTIPSRFFICVEQGLKGANPDFVDEIARFDVQPRSLGELFEMLAAFKGFAREAGHHHLVVDSLSGIERLINLHTCKLENVAHMEAKDFKKVWTAAIPHWQRVQAELDAVRAVGVHLWVIAHSQEGTETATDTGDTYGKWDLAFQGAGKTLVELRQLWRGWADNVFFIDWDATVQQGKSMGQKAVARYRARILRTRETPGFFAKTRANLPTILPASWTDLQAAMRAGSPAPEAKLRAQIDTLLVQLGEGEAAFIRADLEAAKTPAALSAVLSRAQGLLAILRQEQEEERSDEPPAAEEQAPPLDEVEPGASEEPPVEAEPAETT